MSTYVELMLADQAAQRGAYFARQEIMRLCEDVGLSEEEAAIALLAHFVDTNHGPYCAEYGAYCDAVESTLKEAISYEI